MVTLDPQTNMAVAEQYFQEHFLIDDYHSEKESIVGEWIGQGVERLGLDGPVQKDDYRALLHGDLARFGQKNRPRKSEVIYYDLCFSMPKSISLVAMQDERVKALFLNSVKAHFPRVEKWAQVRDRRGEKWNTEASRATGNLVGALFLHESSRALDPDLHVHVVIPNLTYDAERRQWLALKPLPLFQRKKLSDAAVLNDMARGLQKMGYEIEASPESFEIKGFQRATIEKFSLRSEAIDKKIAEWEADPRELRRVAGIYGYGGKALTETEKRQLAALETRPRKVVAARADLAAAMRERFSPEERAFFDGLIEKAKQANTSFWRPSLSAREAMDHAVAHHFERASVATESELLRESLLHGLGQVTYAEVERQLQREEFIRQGDYLTTQEVLREEAEMVAFVREGRGTCPPLGRRDYVPANKKLSPEQIAAVRHVLGSYDRVVGIRGAAGTGKTWMMKEAVRGIEEGGRKVFTFAPSASASRGVLREEGFKEADTLARLLIDPALQERVKEQVIWVDEAGLVSAKQVRALFDLAGRQEARVILSGDVRQHQAVERGDALRVLETHAGMKSAELTTIQRQQNAAYKEVIQSLDARDIDDAFQKLNAMGAIREADGEERYHQLADDYVECRQRKQSVLVVSPTHAEGNRMTEEIRTRLKEAKLLKPVGREMLSLVNLNWTEAQRREAKRYRPGQIVQFFQNASGFRKSERLIILEGAGDAALIVRAASGEVRRFDLSHAGRFQVFEPRSLEIAKGEAIRVSQNGLTLDGKHRLQNGEIRRVKGFTRAGDLRLDNGWVIARDFGHLHHGYAVTSHASQGKSVDQVLVAVNAVSALAAGSMEQMYVSLSRGRHGVRLYTDNKEAVLEVAKVSAARPSAHDLANQEAIAKASRSRIARAMREQMRFIARRTLDERRRAEAARTAQTEGMRVKPDTRVKPIFTQRIAPIKHSRGAHL